MPTVQNPIDEGVELGMRRCRENLRGFTHSDPLRVHVEEEIQQVVNAAGGRGWSLRAQILAAEVLTLAMVTRGQYKEPPLTAEQMADFLQHLFVFLNSWCHE